MRSILLWIAVAVCSLGSVAAVIQSGSSDGFREPRDTETAISFLENESIASKASMVPLTLIQGADSKGAVCLDGTLPGYHLDRGFGSGANSWLIHLESFGVREMDGFGSNKRTLAVDKWIEIVNGKGYNVGEATQFHPTRSSDYQRSIPLPPGGVTAAHTSAPIPDLWRFTDPETKRKKRIATYKAYAMEGKVKSTVKKGFSWIKNRCSLVIHGL